jgi:hypothetical protein
MKLSTKPLLEEEQAAGTIVEAQPRQAVAVRHRFGFVWFAVLLAVIAVGVLTVVVWNDGQQPDTDVAGDRERPLVGSQEHLQQLANQGYIPREAVDERQLLIERLAARRAIPPQSVQSPPRDIPADLRYTRYEEQLIRAVEAGHVPRETIGDELRFKYLVNGSP